MESRKERRKIKEGSKRCSTRWVETRKRQYRSGLFFSPHTRGMVGIVHKSLQNRCTSRSASMIAKLC
ncbi:hypothetical protein F7O85_21020 [Vibrio panuliri]|nr:hypothetical protein F7O85_21020 [Vibrio panuliri]